MKPMPAILKARKASGNVLATTATPEAASEIQTRFAAHIPAAGAIDAQKP